MGFGNVQIAGDIQFSGTQRPVVLGLLPGIVDVHMVEPVSVGQDPVLIHIAGAVIVADIEGQAKGGTFQQCLHCPSLEGQKSCRIFHADHHITVTDSGGAGIPEIRDPL